MFKSVDPKPNFPKLEEEILKFWEDNKIFEKSLEKTKDEKPFVFYEGPPTANAAPGIHHVEARAFKDLYPRYQTMRGRYVARKAGWDTHGLPVELQIEKKLGISGKKQIESLKDSVSESIAYFNKLCRESVWEFKGEWEKLTKRMAFWIDTENPYITYENSYIEKVWQILHEIWKKKLIYQGHKVVPYCPRCGTALSSHEVAQGYERVKDNSVFVKFKLYPGDKIGNFEVDNDTYILSWTTTPWTLPGNVALAVGKSIKYHVLSITGKDERYIVAADLAEKILDTEYEILDTISGKDLVGLEYEPLFEVSALKNDKSHKIYAADFVNTEDGTGVVHTAVMYGEDDYQLGEKEGLPKHHTVDEEGKFTDDLQSVGLAGLKVKDKETEKKIIAYLKDVIFEPVPYEHEYPHCWRCKNPLLYYARNSWYIKVSDIRKKLQKNNEKINWIPEYIKEGRFGQWLTEAKDWAISRERYWGTPIPIWQCIDCENSIMVGSIAELKNNAVNFQFPISNFQTNTNDQNSKLDLHRPYVDQIQLKCRKCGGKMKRVPEVLDVWFDSGSMPFAQGTDQFPADFISEAIDQTRGWFYTLLVVSTLVGKGTPYKNVVCLGHLLDEKHEKMSKSKGNVVDAFKLGDKLGFDILRWYFYTVNQPGDSKLFTESDLMQMQRKTQNILWNVYKYFVTYANEAGWTFTKETGEQIEQTAFQSENILDKWQNARLQDLINNVTESLDSFDAFRAGRAIDEFINELSTWYLRRSRGRSDNEFFATMYRSLIYLTKLIAPFMPYLAEGIYQNLDVPGYAESVHLTNWPQAKKLSKSQQKLLDDMRVLRKIVEEAHALRAKAGVKLRQPLAKLAIPETVILSGAKDFRDSSSQTRQNDNSLLEILKDEVNVKEITIGKSLELTLELTLELKIEGITAELTRQIQATRKNQGLKIGEIAELHYKTESDILERALAAVDKKKTYLSSISKKQDLNGNEIKVEGEGLKIKIINFQ